MGSDEILLLAGEIGMNGICVRLRCLRWGGVVFCVRLDIEVDPRETCGVGEIKKKFPSGYMHVFTSFQSVHLRKCLCLKGWDVSGAFSFLFFLAP
ncbi:hypothetical protein CDAR_116981 [Caerostris darwini]|uniref:Uncharacterized protein n=1 Tax=Caerostris darwini TaxID=1538125 RepID=A0AAV4WBT2_9ARAC|nr:hypothetical protein CDAR_116981 [Caerostris darwini]